jgi:hypothetical protein
LGKLLDNKYTWLLFALLLNVVYFFVLDLSYYLDINTLLSTDALSYLYEMKAIKYHEIHSEIRPFGYPLLLLAADFFSNDISSLFKVLYGLQCILFLCTLGLLFSILSKILNNKIATIAVILIASNPTYITFCFIPVTEILFTFCLMALAYYLFHFLQSKHTKYLPGLAFVCCYAALVRPGFYYMALVIMLVILYYCIRYRKYITAITCVLLFAITIGTQLYIMKTQYGMLKISAIDITAFSRYMNTSCIALRDDKSALDVMLERDSMQSVKSAKPTYSLQQYKQETHAETNYLLNHNPTYFIGAYFGNLFSNTHTENKFIKHQPIESKWIVNKLSDSTRIWNMLYIVGLLFFTIAAIIYYFKKRLDLKNPIVQFALTLLLICNYIFLTSGISYFQGDRFHNVFFPILCIAFACIYKSRKNKFIIG